MLRIRLTRTGKTRQESFRLVVAEHARPVKGKFIEVLGHFQPAKIPKVFQVKKDRVAYWMSKGAQPSGSVASLLKKDGMPDMDRYMSKRMSNIKKKSEIAKEEKAAQEAKPAVVPAAADSKK